MSSNFKKIQVLCSIKSKSRVFLGVVIFDTDNINSYKVKLMSEILYTKNVYPHPLHKIIKPVFSDDVTILGGSRGFFYGKTPVTYCGEYDNTLFGNAFNEKFASARGYIPREYVARLLREKFEESLAVPAPFWEGYMLNPNRRVAYIEMAMRLHNIPYSQKLDNLSKLFTYGPAPFNGGMYPATWRADIHPYILLYDKDVFERDRGLIEIGKRLGHANTDPEGIGPGLDALELDMVDRALCKILLTESPFRGISFVIPKSDSYFGFLRTFFHSGYKYQSKSTGREEFGADFEHIRDVLYGDFAHFPSTDYGEIFNKIMCHNFDPMTVTEYVFSIERSRTGLNHLFQVLVQNPKYPYVLQSLIFRSKHYNPLPRIKRIEVLSEVSKEWNEIERLYGINNPAAKYLTPDHIRTKLPKPFHPTDWEKPVGIRYEPVYVGDLVDSAYRYIPENMVRGITEHHEYFRKIVKLSREWKLHYIHKLARPPKDNIFWANYKDFNFPPPAPSKNFFSEKILDRLVMGKWRFDTGPKKAFWDFYHNCLDIVFSPITKYSAIFDRKMGYIVADKFENSSYKAPNYLELARELEKVELILIRSNRFSGYCDFLKKRRNNFVKDQNIDVVNFLDQGENQHIANDMLEYKFNSYCNEYLQQRITDSLNTQFLQDIDLDLFAQFIFS